MAAVNIPLGEDSSIEEHHWGQMVTGVNTVLHITPTTNEYLSGVGRRFFTEHEYTAGIEILFDLLNHPFVLAETTKLFQEVLYLPASVRPPQLPSLISNKITDWIQTRLVEIDVDTYFQNCLHAYITGVIGSELVWSGNRRVKKLERIKTIPPSLYWVDGTGLRFRKTATSFELTDKNPYKYLTFKYSSTLDISPLGDGVGKVLYYVLRSREQYQCMLETFAQKGITPTLIVKTESGIQRQTVLNICKALASKTDWKTIPVPKGITIEPIQTNKDWTLYEYLLSQNAIDIYRLISGETVVGADTTTGQRGAQEASNLRKARAIALARKVLRHINQDLIPVMVSAEFGPQSSYPSYSYALPVLNKQNLASISDAIAVATTFGYEISPAFWEENYGIDILNYGADRRA
jgi:hypothetical protein